MDTNDFLGSFAQENVSFQTRVVRTTRVGDIYWKVMVFVENNRFVDASTPDWVLIPGSSTIKALTVTAADYASFTTGVLRSWLYDLFCNGFNGDCILVACAPKSTSSIVYVFSSDGETFYEDEAMTIVATIPEGITPTLVEGTKYQYTSDTPSSAEFIEAMDTAYDTLKAYAYHKTVCAAPTLALDTDAFAVDPDIAVELATLCATDADLLSSAPYLPFTTTNPATPTSDPLYAALKAANKDAFMSAHQDTTRNAALFALGVALGSLNGSGTSVGNSIDMCKTGYITSSGPDGMNLSKAIRDNLKTLNIQTWKPIGDNSGNVAATGAKTLNGTVVQAQWIICYVTYMTKVAVAQMITVPNFLKNANNYTKICGVLLGYLKLFGPTGSRRLKDIAMNTPSFENLPEAKDDVIIVPDAWSATYVDQIREVQITGTLYIGE